MNPVVLTLRADGSCACFYTEAIDLMQLGKLEVQRATTIEFNNEKQLWEVVDGYGEILFQHASRAVCLNWEQLHLN
jgi:hypothetical protein